MSEDEIIDSLDLMAESIHLVQERFSGIHVPDDFALTPEGGHAARCNFNEAASHW